LKPNRGWTPYLFVLPAFAVFAISILLPMLGTFGLSFTRWDGSGALKFKGVANYIRAFHDSVYIASYWHVLIYVVATIVLEVVAGLLLAGLCLPGQEPPSTELPSLFLSCCRSW